MRHFRLLSLGIICALALSVVNAGVATGELWDAASDWRTTYSNTAAVAASTHASWGAGNVWSAGELSWNGTNQEAGNGATSTQIIPTYYLPSTGFETIQSTNEATYHYTVPFQAYTFNPGQTNQVAVGPTVVNQINYGKGPTGLGGGGAQSALKLPSGTTVGTGAYAPTTTSGYLQDIGKATGPASNTNVEGFSTTSYNPSGGKFTDGGGSVQAAVSGVFYNYGAATTSTSLSALNFPSSSATDTLQISENFGGPTFVAWTAPMTAVVTISFTAADQTNSSDGDPGFYILTANPANPSGAPTMLFEATNYSGASNAAMANNGSPTSMQGGYTQYSTLGGSLSDYNPNYGPGGSGDPTIGLAFTSAANAYYVTTGQTIYFVADPGHNENPTHSNHTFGTGTDSVALSAQVVIDNPEPSSLVLLGIGAAVLAIAGRRRMRRAAS